jgi:[ribosomal protein S18]-alanine N-acetyltransferase
MKVIHVSSDDRGRAEQCARLMVTSEPWLTLRRSWDSALRALQDPGKELHAVLNGDDVGGFILLDLRGPLAGYIQTICVRSDLRGHGLGSALITWAERRIFQESPNVFLCVSSFNDGAQRLYERMGYEVVGQRDELLLRKTRGPWAEFQPPPA